MEKFLGVLCCGGRGTRLGIITRYISKAFIPVYDRPVFMYGLERLQESEYIDRIVILTNRDNDARLHGLGFKTVIQDDSRVKDMLSGLHYLRRVTGEERPAVLMPCDNISRINVDRMIKAFLAKKPDILINIRKITNRQKLSQMGVFDPSTGKIDYKPHCPKTCWGVLAPYVVAPELDLSQGPEAAIFNRCRLAYSRYSGYWFDIGDLESWQEANTRLARHLIRQKDDAEIGTGGVLAKLVAQGKRCGIIDLTDDPALQDDFIEKCRFRNRELVIAKANDPEQQRFAMVFILHHRHLYGMRRLPRLIGSLFQGAKRSSCLVLYDCNISSNRIICLRRRQIVWFTGQLVVFNLMLLALRLAKKIFSRPQGKSS